jgi:hypothetical protein
VAVVPKFGKIVKFFKGPWINGAEGTGVYHASRTTFSVFTVHKYAKSKSALYSYVFLRQFSVSVKFLAW